MSATNIPRRIEKPPRIIYVMRRYLAVNVKHTWVLVATILSSLVTSVGLSIMSQCLHAIIDGYGITGTIYTNQTVVLLIALVVLIPSQYLQQYFGIRYSEMCSHTMRHMTFTAISRIDKHTLDSQRTGEMLSRANSDLIQINGILQDYYAVKLPQQIIGLGALLVSILISWQLTLFSLAIVPIIAVLQIRISAPITRLVQQRQRAAGESLSTAKNLMDGYEVAKAYNLADRLQHRYDMAVDQAAASEINVHRATIWLSPLGQIMVFLPQIIICGFGVYLVHLDSITSGGIMSVILLSVFIANPIRDFSTVLANLQTARGCAGRVFDLWDMTPEPTGGAQRKSDGDIILFHNVVFSYAGERTLLNGLSFSIQRGEHVALVGTSGSGKSTTIKLLMGLYHKKGGEILLFGHSIEAWSMDALREQISYVGQDTYLFAGSIWDNVALGNLAASNEQIEAAIDAASLNDVDTKREIGEHGLRLSGGQQQRVAIARAILKDAPLLILDEPTAALDTHSEALVSDALWRLMQGRTTIVIAHRLSTICKADRILVVDNGQIVEEGTHRDLLERSGRYAHLYRLQYA